MLPAVEEGLLTLIGATTENPYFEVNSALLSRCQVYELQPLTAEQVEELLAHGRWRTPSGGWSTRRRSTTRRWRCWRSAPAATPGSPSRRLERAVARAADLDRAGDPSKVGSGRRRRGRGRAAAQGARLRPSGRPPLRLHLRLDQGDAGLRRRRLALLPGGDAGGWRGPALHRPSHGHPRLRGRRQRRPAGAARGGRGGTGGRPGRPAGVRAQPRPGLPSTSPSHRSPTPPTKRSAAPAARCGRTAPRRRPTTCATLTIPAPGSSAGARATATRTTSRAPSATSR